MDSTLKAPESECSTKCKGQSSQLCGAGKRLSVYKNTVYNEPPPLPNHVPRSGNYQWAGCFTEATTGRALSGASYATDSMTVDTCAAYCAANGWLMMGVEYVRECESTPINNPFHIYAKNVPGYCGNSTGQGSVAAPLSECSTLCKGNQVCFTRSCSD